MERSDQHLRIDISLGEVHLNNLTQTEGEKVKDLERSPCNVMGYVPDVVAPIEAPDTSRAPYSPLKKVLM